MDWILSHLQVVIAVAAAIAYWFNQQKTAAREDKDKTAPESNPFEQASTEGGDDERTRRVQEEIRRKIAERRGTAPQPPAAPRPTGQPVAPPYVAPRPVAREMMGGLRERLEAKLAEARAKSEAAAQEARRQREEEERALEAERLATQLRATEIAAQAALASAAIRPAETKNAREVRPWPSELRDPQSLRRAMILREVLGPPVGLR
jgi:hypothetical protein